MSNIINLARPETATVAEGLRAIAEALERGDLIEPPYALVVFGIADTDPNIQIMPVGGRLPGVIESVGMLTMAAGAAAFGEADNYTIKPD